MEYANNKYHQNFSDDMTLRELIRRGNQAENKMVQMKLLGCDRAAC